MPHVLIVMLCNTKSHFQTTRKATTLAVGMLYLSHKFFMKFLEPSKTAASDEGPKAGIPALTRSSARPETRGASGPTTTSPIPHLRQKEITAELSRISRSEMQVASLELEMPAFPGAQKTASHDGDCRKAKQRACSLAPSPMTNTATLSCVKSTCKRKKINEKIKKKQSMRKYKHYCC